MQLQRRRFLQLAAGVSTLAPASRLAWAQAYPVRTIAIVVPYGGGGPADAVARPLAEHMSKTLGQQVVIENVGGQSGATGVARAAKAAPDGYTLSFGHNGSHVVNGAIYSLPFDLRSDFEPIALLPSNTLSISARKELPIANLKDLIAHMQANPGKVTVASAGGGSGTNVNAIYFQNRTGTRFQFKMYQNVQPAMAALVAGDVDIMFDQASNSLPNLRAGRIKSFAVTANRRMSSAPEIPTTDEAGLPEFYSGNWYGLWALKGTPKNVIATLNRAAVAALADPAIVKRFADQGLDMPPADQRTPEAFGDFHRAEIDKWWPLIKAAGIKPE